MVCGGNRRPSGGVSQIKGIVKTNLLNYRYAKASLYVKPVFSSVRHMCIVYSKESETTVRRFVYCTVMQLQVLRDRNAIQVKVKMYDQQKHIRPCLEVVS